MLPFANSAAHATMAGGLARSDSEAVREAALGFAFSPNPAVSSAALVAVSQQRPAPMVSKAIDGLVRMRSWLSEARRPNVDTAIHAFALIARDLVGQTPFAEIPLAARAAAATVEAFEQR
jgi:16S rRNA A1518/A1519 N6-dimethyltransferase RsmA/KsgA/DIM1 with predicted DNA glycosylase/AP lyase activity